MVWRRMGLLDDAIRDHLELKRLRGADPGEVAREQREALESDLAGEPLAGKQELATALEDLGTEDGRQTMPVGATPAVTPTSSPDPARAPQPAHSADRSTVAEETAELDMRSVLGADDGGAAEHGSFAGAAAGGSPGSPPSFDDLNEDQLEWEVPGDPSAETPLDAEQNDDSERDDGR
jgi:hypothetical protein